ncbi:MAG: PilN domain-containing protein [Eubacteriales bacterium]
MKDINLFEGIKKSAPQKKAPRAVSFGLVLLIVCAVVLGGFYGFLKYMETGLDSQMDLVNQGITALKANNAGQEDASAKQNQLAAIAAYNTALTSFQKDVQAYPKINLALLNDMAKRMPSDVKVDTISYQEGIFTLAGSASNVDSPANFAAALKSSAYFDSVTYMGSIYQAPVAGAVSGIYQYSVQCHMKGGAVQ